MLVSAKPYRSFVSAVRPLCMVLMVVVFTATAAADSDLEFRGQGPNNICFSFAEEQLLKDALCTVGCSDNASEWRVSIFDIVRFHMAEDVRVTPDRPEKNRLKYTFEKGSRFVFPYRDQRSLRASACTLEREIFRFNRDPRVNPRMQSLRDQLIGFYEDSLPVVALASSVPEFRSLIQILLRLARESKNSTKFFDQVLDFTTCSGRIELPDLSMRHELSRDEQVIRSTITQKLKEGRSMFAAVCGDTLRTEVADKKDCEGHAVVLKEIRVSMVNPAGEEVRVVDSSFFSRRARNVDGSIWIPLDVVVASVRLNGDLSEEFRLKLSKNFRDLRRDAISEIRGSAHVVPRLTLDEFLALAPTEQAVDLIRLSHRVLQSEVETSDALIESFKEAVSVEYRRQEEARLKPVRFMSEGLVWLE